MLAAPPESAIQVPVEQVEPNPHHRPAELIKKLITAETADDAVTACLVIANLGPDSGLQRSAVVSAGIAAKRNLSTWESEVSTSFGRALEAVATNELTLQPDPEASDGPRILIAAQHLPVLFWSFLRQPPTVLPSQRFDLGHIMKVGNIETNDMLLRGTADQVPSRAALSVYVASFAYFWHVKVRFVSVLRYSPAPAFLIDVPGYGTAVLDIRQIECLWGPSATVSTPYFREMVWGKFVQPNDTQTA